MINCARGINKKYLNTLATNYCILVTKRTYPISGNSSLQKLPSELEFTSNQQKYLLDTLNQADTEQLVRYNLPKNRIKSFYNWRKQNGQFNSLTDVLYVEGLGVKTLTKVCKKIIELENDKDVTSNKKLVKSRGQILNPIMSDVKKKELKTAVGIHLYANGLSWARIKNNNTLMDWDLLEFTNSSKKMSPIDAFQLVIKVCNKIPASDAYIFESPTSVTPAAQQSPVSVAAYAQKIQFLSMLLTVLNTSKKHNPDYNSMDPLINKNDPEFEVDTKVFFLKPRLSARLFRTLIGSERVSAGNTVAKILGGGEVDKNLHTPLSVSTELHNMYNKELPVNKEVLGQALLLIMTFMDVCIYENPNSLKVLSCR